MQKYNFICCFVCCETPVTRREGNRLRVLRIFRPKREEVRGGRRRLHNEELRNLFASLNIVRAVIQGEMGGACSTHERGENIDW